MSGGNGDTPLELLRETAARSPQAVLFAKEAGNTTAQDLVDLVATRLEPYRRAGLPAWGSGLAGRVVRGRRARD